MTHRKFLAHIDKTGFVLENQIAQQLKAARWTVISNRYYVDDAEESVREIDLIAYQVSKVKHLDVYTSLIISCKKSETNAWALLSRKLDLKDPNYDWHPLHVWANDRVISFQLAVAGSAKRYHEQLKSLGVANALQTPAVEVFAFQEMNKTSGTPQNDKNIFSAITSLMKAQAYELGALPQRKKTPSVYQFNLLSVVDAELVRLKFEDEQIEATAVDSEQYIARYIIRKRETFSRIRFLRADTFSQILPEYGQLHKANCRWFEQEHDSFYKDIVEDSKRLEVLIDDFRKQIGWFVSWRLKHLHEKTIEPTSINLYWNVKKRSLQIWAPYGTSGERALNADTKAREQVAKALEDVYRYTGEFEFEDDDIPF